MLVMSESLQQIIEVGQQERLAEIQRAWRAYFGRYRPGLRVKHGEPDDNVVVNFIRLLVDKGVFFLFGKGVSFELDELRETPAEEWLNEVWERNRKMLLLQKLGLNGSISGHAFVKIQWTPGGYPRLVVLDPETVAVKLREDDIDQVEGYEIRYPSRAPDGKVVLVRQRIEREGAGWVIIDERGTPDSPVWTEVEREVWPWPFPPIVDCQNLPLPNSYWGMPDVTGDMVVLQEKLNFLASNLVKIIRHHAHPKTFGHGFTARQALALGPDDVLILNSPQGFLKSLAPDGDISGSLAFYREMKRALHEVAQVPEIALGRVEGSGQVSGVALKVLYGPLLDKTATKRQTYGYLLQELNRRLLAVGGHARYEDVRVKVVWPELLPADPKEQREVALLDMQLGVSQDTILRGLGYDPELEQEKAALTAQDTAEALVRAFDRGG